MAEETRAINFENNLDNMIKTAQDSLNQSIVHESKLFMNQNKEMIQ